MYVCVIEWVLFLASKKSQDRFASIISPLMISNISRWHLCLKSRAPGSGTNTKKWRRPLWSSVLASCSLIYLSLVLHVLWLCFHSLHQAKIDSVIDILLRGVWLSIWDGFSKCLLGSQRVGMAPTFLITPLASTSFSLLWKVWIWPFHWSPRLPYSATCD